MDTRDEKLIEMAQQHAPLQPKCPKCSHAPLEFHCNVVKTGAGHIVSIIWCGHCGHTLNVQFVGMDQPQPMLVRPS